MNYYAPLWNILQRSFFVAVKYKKKQKPLE